MVGYASEEAVEQTLATGLAHRSSSRSRGKLWQKGESSGNAVKVAARAGRLRRGLRRVLGRAARADAATPARRAASSASSRAARFRSRGEPPQTLLGTLEAVLESRKRSTGAVSYTKSLYDAGAHAIGAKIGEEAAELARAIAGESDERVVAEAADTLYHVLVGLRWRAIPLRRVLAELARRLGTSGHEEKAQRT